MIILDYKLPVVTHIYFGPAKRRINLPTVLANIDITAIIVVSSVRKS